MTNESPRTGAAAWDFERQSRIISLRDDEICVTAASYWLERSARIGPKTESYIRGVFESDDVLYQLRAVQSLVTHLEGFPPERAEAACQRAAYYGITTYQGIENILAQALDREPLPPMTVQTAWVDRPRFARSAGDFVQEGHHEHH